MKTGIFCIALMFPLFASSSERIGYLKIDELHLRTEISFREGQENNLSISQSSLSFLWNKDQNILGTMSLGLKNLINEPVYFTSTTTEELSIVEAYGEYQGAYGSLKLGMIPVGFGYEGSLSESELYFERNLFYQNRLMPLRDLGLSLYTEHNGVYTGLVVHNGETTSQGDSRLWFSSKWGWKNNRNIEVGAAFSTGTTKPQSTSTSGNSFLGVDNNLEAKWRWGNIFAHWYPNEWELVLEAYLGTLIQNDQESANLVSGHFDISYQWRPTWSWHGRYEYFDPNSQVEEDGKKHFSVGFSFHDRYKTSSVLLLFTKKIEESSPVNDDEFRIAWKLTPKTKK